MIKLKAFKKNEKIAIAICTKNRYSYLAILLASLLVQTYRNWTLVINDSSDRPIEADEVLKELFQLIKKEGHAVKIIHTDSGWDRHQRTMEAVPPSVEFIVRIDDDIMLTPDFLENILKPYRLLEKHSIAAVGGCYPETYMKPSNLDTALKSRFYVPRITDPKWLTKGSFLQGHYYMRRCILGAENLLGHAICYRHSVAKVIGGWAVKGYSTQAHREESDFCIRAIAAGFELFITTEAVAWHLYASGGGSRTVFKTGGEEGVVLISPREELTGDNELFKARLKAILPEGFSQRKLNLYLVEKLEKKIH